jgi:hypothetical protein
LRQQAPGQGAPALPGIISRLRAAFAQMPLPQLIQLASQLPMPFFRQSAGADQSPQLQPQQQQIFQIDRRVSTGAAPHHGSRQRRTRCRWRWFSRAPICQLLA